MEYDFLENNLLIICPSSYKKEILKYLTEKKLMYSIKFMSINEYIKNYFFDYDEKTIDYLVKKKMKVENAITLIKNLYYIEDKVYHNDKLDYLVNIKKELDEHKLLIYNILFKKMLDKYKIVIFGYGKIDSWQLKLFNNPKVINYFKKREKYKIYSIKNISSEVECVFQQIVDLLIKGVDINKISLMNVDNEYLPILKRMSIFYDIPIAITNSSNLLGTKIGKDFYDLILSGQTEEEIFKYLEKYRENKNYSLLVNILNKYVSFNLLDIKDQIKYELSITKVKDTLYENVLKIKNVFEHVGDDEYIFLMNFNNPAIPNLSLDIDYITDNIKDLVSLPKTVEINKLSKENTINYLSSINNLVITYKETSPFNTYQPSILLDDIDYELLEYKRDFKYSEMANKNLYTMYLDDLVKFGIKNENINMLYKNYDTNNYLSYNNEFTSLDNSEFLKYINNELILSYSSIDNFYKCGFKYYLGNVLKIDLYEETFMTIIGNLFHDVLRHMNDDDFNLENRYNLYLKDKIFTEKEQFFLQKLKKDLEFVIDVIRKHQFITGFNKMLYEEKIDIKLKNSPYVHFKGFVDKIMYKEQKNETLISIIDYKTGNPDIKIKNLKFGLSMQLPIYLYLVKNSQLFSNMKFVGFYLQHILNVDIKKDKKSVEEQKYDNLKLTGYSLNDKNLLACFDSTYEKSEMIKGLKVTKDNQFAKSSHAISEEEIDSIIALTEKKIIEGMESILKNDFQINPKIIDGKNESCTYCKFSDICYHEEKNNVYLETKEGEDDATLDEGTE